MSDSADGIAFAEAAARRRSRHEREERARRRWSLAVSFTSLGLLGCYLCLLFVVRVTEPVYLILNLLATMTGLCGFIVYLAYELPTVLAELPRASEHERRINLAAIEPIRAELLGRALPSLGLARSREQAAEMDDEELVRRLAGLQRPDWRRIAPIWFVVWLVVVTGVLVGLAMYRPEYGVSLIDRVKGERPVIERHWSRKR